MGDSRHVAELVERLSHRAYSTNEHSGLKPAQWSVLRYFANANRFSKTVSAFARYQGITVGAASQTVGGLVETHLLKRTCDKSDKRRHHLTLTAKATKLICADPICALVEAALELEDSQREVLAAGLTKMLEHVVSQKHGALFGFCDECQFLRCERRTGKPDGYRCAYADQELSADDLNKICINFGPYKLVK